MCMYIYYIYICTLQIYSLSTLENTDEKKFIFVHLPQIIWRSSAPCLEQKRLTDCGQIVSCLMQYSKKYGK